METPKDIPPREIEPVEPKRVIAFANFFKRYMSVSTIVTAALPIPVTSLHWIPTYAAQTKLLSVYTSLFCFLALALIFYCRHQLARMMFPEFYARGGVMIRRFPEAVRFVRRTMIGLLPFAFIVASVASVVGYHHNLSESIEQVYLSPALLAPAVAGSRREYAANAADPAPDDRVSSNAILKYTDPIAVPRGLMLTLLYVSIFVCAEAAFILMAIKEYLQDLVGLTEIDLIRGPVPTPVEVIRK